jgi:hypothetical protein
MFRIIVALIALIATTVGPAFANPNFYGFGSMTIPTKDGAAYEFARARIGFYTPIADSLTSQFEYDIVTSTMKYANVAWQRGWLTLTGGQFLNPPQFSYPGPRALRFPDYPFAESRFTVAARGVMASVSNGAAAVRLAHFGENTVSASGKFTVIKQLALTAYWEDTVGYGGTIVHAPDDWLTQEAGFTQFTDGQTAVFGQANVDAYRGLVLRVQYDTLLPLGTNERWFAGATYEVVGNTFIRCFYDTRAKGAHASLAFAF